MVPGVRRSDRTARRTLRSLRDAGLHVQSLPKAEQAKQHWQDAAEHLLRAAEGSEAWVLFARMFMLRALNHGRKAAPITPRKKAAKTYRVIR